MLTFAGKGSARMQAEITCSMSLVVDIYIPGSFDGETEFELTVEVNPDDGWDVRASMSDGTVHVLATLPVMNLADVVARHIMRILRTDYPGIQINFSPCHTINSRDPQIRDISLKVRDSAKNPESVFYIA
jgi:hypothetical protein